MPRPLCYSAFQCVLLAISKNYASIVPCYALQFEKKPPLVKKIFASSGVDQDSDDKSDGKYGRNGGGDASSEKSQSESKKTRENDHNSHGAVHRAANYNPAAISSGITLASGIFATYFSVYFVPDKVGAKVEAIWDFIVNEGAGESGSEKKLTGDQVGVQTAANFEKHSTGTGLDAAQRCLTKKRQLQEKGSRNAVLDLWPSLISFLDRFHWKLSWKLSWSEWFHGRFHGHDDGLNSSNGILDKNKLFAILECSVQLGAVFKRVLQDDPLCFEEEIKEGVEENPKKKTINITRVRIVLRSKLADESAKARCSAKPVGEDSVSKYFGLPQDRVYWIWGWLISLDKAATMFFPMLLLSCLLFAVSGCCCCCWRSSSGKKEARGRDLL